MARCSQIYRCMYFAVVLLLKVRSPVGIHSFLSNSMCGLSLHPCARGAGMFCFDSASMERIKRTSGRQIILRFSSSPNATVTYMSRHQSVEARKLRRLKQLKGMFIPIQHYWDCNRTRLKCCFIIVIREVFVKNVSSSAGIGFLIVTCSVLRKLQAIN
jgi:hypothetical protein